MQDDTTSAVAACLAAFGNKIPVAHVEASLPTCDLARPYPEEAWRTLIEKCADLQFSPPQQAADDLLRDGVALAKGTQVVNPSDDGKAALRIANRIEAFLVSVNSVSEGCKSAA